jgi:hypothetical protein
VQLSSSTSCSPTTVNLRLLFLTQIFPYPPDSGPSIKTWHVLRYLVGWGHEVTLVSFLRREEQASLPVLRVMCDMYPVPLRRSRLADGYYWLRRQMSKRPLLIEQADLKTIRRQVEEPGRSRTFSVDNADQLTMTQFALDFQGSTPLHRLVFDAHSHLDHRRAHNTNCSGNPKPVLSLETKRVEHYEGSLIR